MTVGDLSDKLEMVVTRSLNPTNPGFGQEINIEQIETVTVAIAVILAHATREAIESSKS